MPALEALVDRFEAAHTQPLGVSIDSVYCHANWARSLGGVSFPLLADFHPKGAVARACGLYLEAAGITDRATVIIDKDGVVRHASSVGPGGERDLAELAVLCEGVDAAYGAGLPAAEGAPGLAPETTLYVKTACGFSASVLMAVDNLHLADSLAIKNVTEDAAALRELEQLAGNAQAPCLVVGGTPTQESADIILYLASRATTL